MPIHMAVRQIYTDLSAEISTLLLHSIYIFVKGTGDIVKIYSKSKQIYIINNISHYNPFL